jgi:transcriptional antiterminator RfaH
MSIEPFWSVARTLPRREAFAAERLRAEGFEILLPLIPAGRSSTAPLFVSYVFVNLNGSRSHWHAVNRTLGIVKLVRFGDTPAHCPTSEVMALKARMDDEGIVRLSAPPSSRKRAYAQGERVRIVAGPFAGLAAIHTGMTAREREIVLINILGATRPVAIAAGFVRPQ